MLGLRVDITDRGGPCWFRGRGVQDLLLEPVVLLGILQPLLKLLSASLQSGQQLILLMRRLVDLGFCLAHHPGTSHNRSDGESLRDHAST